jgi:ribonuclease Z
MPARELIALGTASQVPTRSRNHNGYLLRWDDSLLLFDPGEGTQRQMTITGVTASQITHICVTHFHGDHCLGLPGVLQRISLDGAAREVDIVYPGESADVLAHLRSAAIFHDRLRLREYPVVSDGPAASGAFQLIARRLAHPVPTYGYRLEEPDGRRMLPDKLAAAGISGSQTGRLIRDGYIDLDGRRIRVTDVSEPRPGQRFAFVMDTGLCDAAFELALGADMLVCESTFGQGQADLAREAGHLTAAQAGQIAAESGARLLVLTHFSQRYESEGTDQLQAEATSVFGGEVILARDLDRIPVPARQSATVA